MAVYESHDVPLRTGRHLRLLDVKKYTLTQLGLDRKLNSLVMVLLSFSQALEIPPS